MAGHTADEIVIVTGLPRSGTSMLMRMLQAGGVPLLVDEERRADESNPRGYFEYAPVKRLKTSADWISLARGKAVKVVSYLLPHLPEHERYRVLFLERDLGEVAASQDRMLGKAPAPPNDALNTIMARQNDHARAWIARTQSPGLVVQFAEAHADPAACAKSVAAFLGMALDTEAMAASVDAALYRNRLK